MGLLALAVHERDAPEADMPETVRPDGSAQLGVRDNEMLSIKM
jgi:hypothetical protein